MTLSNLKQKIIIIVAIIGALLIFLFQRGLSDASPISSNPQPDTQQQNTSNEVKVISTKPENLDGLTILPTQIIEVTFNYPLENVGEFKNKIDPKANYTVKLSDDRKTAKIIPNPTFNVGTGYSLIIQTDSKFDGKRKLDHEIILHFNTVSYNGV